MEMKKFDKTEHSSVAAARLITTYQMHQSNNELHFPWP